MAENENYPINAPVDDATGSSYESDQGGPSAGGSPLDGGGASGFGGGVLGDPLAPAEGYEYDFASGGLEMRTPFDDLVGLPGIDNIGDIFGGESMSGENPFAEGGAPTDSGSPMMGGAPTDSAAPSSNSGNSGGFGGSNADSDSSAPFSNFDPNTDGSPFTDSDNVPTDEASGSEEIPLGEGGSMMGGGFDTSSLTNGIDTGVGNTDNGNGNNYLGDAEGETGSNNQADGNGNYFYGNDNQADGNGNWNFGEGNQTNGNGNWNLNEDSGTPFDNLFSGENNPLAGGGAQAGPGGGGNAPQTGGEDSGSASAEGDIPFASGNNPVFAGGSTTPAPVGEGEMPDTAKNPTGNNNVTDGNGNWNFGSDNTVSGNGNWSFGDDNTVSGSGNRPMGSGNTISGNSNRPTGSDNTITGNRHTTDGDKQNIYGNADRYYAEDEEGNVKLVDDKSARDPNFVYEDIDWTETDQRDSDSESDPLLNGGSDGGSPVVEEQGIDIGEYYPDGSTSSNGLPTSSAPLDGGSAAGIFAAGEVPDGLSSDVLMVS